MEDRMPYCIYPELVNLTGSELTVNELDEIIVQADSEIDACLYEAGLTPPGSDSILKAASLKLSIAGVVTRHRMDGTQPPQLNLSGILSADYSMDTAIQELRNGARLLIVAYIRKATAALRQSSRIYKVNR